MAIMNRWPGLKMPKRICLSSLLKQKSKLIIGLNSGTSADGIDAALVKIDGCGYSSKITLIEGYTYPYPFGMKSQIRRYAESNFDSARAWLQLDVILAELFARAAICIIKKSGQRIEKISLIGSHGQTIRHLPKTKLGAITHQLADPARIAALTGITTVGDFRVADTASGGQGAPLSPIANAILFSKLGKQLAVLNIGGIANISVISHKHKRISFFGCDTGPGNMVIDYLARRLYRKDYDRGGKLAAAGLPNRRIVNNYLAQDFYHIKGPKSVGREDYGNAFAERFLSACNRFKLSENDIIATASMLTAMAAHQCVKINGLKFEKLILAGGGSHNHFIANVLRQLLDPIPIVIADDAGYPADYLEAISFAILANEAINSNRYDLSAVTGSRGPIVLGKICQA
jgi:anhydro-N-acetylmuramic acid kinase